MNTMEVTKFVGAICGSLLIFLLLQTAAHAIYNTEQRDRRLRGRGRRDRRRRRRGGGRGRGRRRPDGGGRRRQGRDRVQEVRRLPQARRRRRRRPAPRTASSAAPVGSVEGFAYSDGMTGAWRRVDARGALRLPRQPEEGRARHQDVLRRPAEARGPGQRHRLSAAARRLTPLTPDLADGARRIRRFTPARPRLMWRNRNGPQGPRHGRTPPRPRRSLLALARRRRRRGAGAGGRGAATGRRRGHRQPRHLGLRRPQVPGGLRALRLREPRRAAGRHDELPRHRRQPDLRQPQRLHPQGRAGPGPRPALRQPARRLRRRARRRLRPGRREPRIPRGPLLGDLQHAPRGDLLRRRRRSPPRTWSSPGRSCSRRARPPTRSSSRTSRASRRSTRTASSSPSRPGRAKRDLPVARRRPLDPAQALLRDRRVRRVDADPAGRLRPLHRRRRRSRQVDPLLQEPRLLGRGPAGQRRQLQLRLHRLRVLRRQQRRLRGAEDRRLPVPPGVSSRSSGPPPTTSRRSRRAGSSARSSTTTPPRAPRASGSTCAARCSRTRASARRSG